MLEESKENRYRFFLKDCGCGDSQTAEFLKLLESGTIAEQIAFLQCLRHKTMTALHEQSRRVDCIDYVIHELGGKQHG